MSFPNIPDIIPKINITFEDSINLLLTSIALEEISLSDLMDAEKNKILYVLKDCKHKDSLLHDSIAVNKSVNDTIQNMIKLQMLLQFKLEHVKEMIPSTTTYSTSTTSTSTTTTFTCSKSTASTTATKTSTCSRSTTTVTTTRTTTCTTTCTTATCSTTTSCECICRCCLKGRGAGLVTNRNDGFYSYTAVLQALIIKRDVQNRHIRYTVQNECETLTMKASGYNVSVECPDCCNKYSMVISGKCHMEKRSKHCDGVYGCGSFKLIVRKGKNGRLEFLIETASRCSPELNHKSGIVQVKGNKSDLALQWGY